MNEDPYAALAPFYDLEFADFDADIGLYLGYAGMVGSPILELGCGTGRLLAPLARAGYDVQGLDSSPTMIGLARERLAREGLSGADVQVGDMRTLAGCAENHYRLVFAAINAFLHLESRPDQLATLSAMRRVLHHDGILVLDVFHPTPTTLQGMDDQLRIEGQWTLPNGERIDRFSSRQVHVAEQRIETTLYYDQLLTDGRLRRTVARYATRYVHRFELEGLLSEAGFVIEGIYGSYQLEPLEDSSPVIILVAHRR